MKKARVLFVEDDPSIGYIIKDNLELNGYEVIHASDGEQAFLFFKEKKIDLCLLDVMLPKKDGFSLASSIRELDLHVPILFLTAKSLSEDKILGFKKGGDDYIIKPYSFEELLLRMEVFLKRSKSLPPLLNRYKVGKYFYDHNNLSLIFNENKIPLTFKEGAIIKLFCENKNIILRREQILNIVWGDDDYFMGRSLDVFISKIRKYFQKDNSIEIQNIHGVGFRLFISEEISS